MTMSKHEQRVLAQLEVSLIGERRQQTSAIRGHWALAASAFLTTAFVTAFLFAPSLQIAYVICGCTLLATLIAVIPIFGSKIRRVLASWREQFPSWFSFFGQYSDPVDLF